MSGSDVEDLLYEWGRAALEDTVKIGYNPTFLSKLKGSTVKSASISQEDYEKVDRAVASLYRTPHLQDVACLIFMMRYDYAQISRIMRRSKSTISKYRYIVVDEVAKKIVDKRTESSIIS